MTFSKKQVKLPLKYRKRLTKYILYNTYNTYRIHIPLIFNTMTTKNFASKYFLIT